ncbi:hypothetical protein QBC44DRAFT_324020 [Cladorrhinum sp. PSN332]|nr:hypothetical protein QBC44DRAFT_324020 [Cladorrhinum sp. PSN332]
MTTGNQGAEAIQPIAPPNKKRVLPFKRTVARKQTPEQPSSASPDAVAAASASANKSDDDDLNLFRRSKEVFTEVLRKVEEEERQASLTPGKQNRKRKSSSDEDSSDIPHKRHQSSSSSMERSPTPGQRISALDSDSDDEIVINKKGKGKGKEVIRTPEIFTPRKPENKKPVLRQTRQTRQTPSSAMSSPVVVIDDSDDDDGGGVLIDSPIPIQYEQNPPMKHYASSRDSSTVVITSTGNNATKDDDDDDNSEDEKQPDVEQDNMDDEWARKALEMRALTEQETVIFMVTSRWPGTSPIKAKRRLVQNLGIVLETWAMKQLQLGIEFPLSTMFATWKGQKIYTHSNLASLGIRVDENGWPICRPNEPGYFFDDEGRPLGAHLEVWDQKLYDDHIDQKNRERALKLGVLDEEYAAESERESPEPELKKRYRVILKAKELEPLKMAVMDDTTVEYMIDAFCQQRKIPNEWDVAIYFDGERLDEDSLVVDADIDPDETNQFEVHIKK